MVGYDRYSPHPEVQNSVYCSWFLKSENSQKKGGFCLDFPDINITAISQI